MTTHDSVYFFPFRFESQSGRLWRDDEERPLRPKSAAVLHYLVQHAGQVVSKNELLTAVWPDVIVSEAVLVVCVNELRQALGDDPQQPRFIETVHRRGYRFIAEVVSNQHSVGSRQEEEKQKAKGKGQKPVLPAPVPQAQVSAVEVAKIEVPSPAPYFVGREAELAQLQQWWEQALSGQRQVVFIAGEPGIGKTTLLDRFLARITDGHEHEAAFWIGRGQCMEQYGEGEAYLPVLEALGQLCRGPEGQRVREVLHRDAPTWLLQMPGLQEATEVEALRLRAAGATRERMLREMADALEALSTERGMVFVCEDLHASDHSTIELLAYLAQRRGPSHLLVLGTYRPVEVVLRAHPLRQIVQELRGRQQCQYLPLGLLSQAAVGTYLAQRLASGTVPPPVAAEVYQRTEGNALFMASVVEYLLQQEVLRKEEDQWRLRGHLQNIWVPESVRQLIEKQVEQLTAEEQQVLEVASVAGIEFSAAAASAGLTPATSRAEVSRVEEHYEQLSRQTAFLRVSGSIEWPDGTVTMRYGFRHALYQEVMCERMSPGRQSQLHRRIGERLETAYGQGAGEIAAALAVHFERGRDYQRAVHYRQQAGENALRRSAHQEALSHLTRGLELLNSLPDTPERSHRELELQMTLGPVLIATAGYAAPAVANAYTRAQELCEQVGETALLFRVLFGLWAFRIVRAEHRTALALAKQLLDLAESQQDTALPVEAHWALGASSLMLGEMSAARTHFDQSIALYDPHQHRSLAFLYGYDPGMSCRTVGAWTLWILGYPEQALERSRDAITFAQELSHPFSLAYAIDHAARLHHFRREPLASQERIQAGIALSTEQGFPFYLAQGAIFLGAVSVQQGQGREGIEQVQRGIAAFRATGAELWRPYFLGLLAEAYGQIAQAGEGLALLAEALAAVERADERFYEAELYRLKGELTLQEANQKSKIKSQKSKRSTLQPLTPSTQEAEACFLEAIKIARKQQAKSLELRAVMSLSRLWQQQGKGKEAHQMLSEVYGWFTEGFETKDLQEAEDILEDLRDQVIESASHKRLKTSVPQ
jgi:DNA-binding winged helix-turn-helix (wHTH) protein/predicted ATPase